MDEPLTVAAWAVTDTGLVAAPGGFRRLPGAVRHHQGRGDRWPTQLTLTLADGIVAVVGAGEWPVGEVSVRRVSEGPPVTFVIAVPEGDHLVAAAADETTDRFLTALEG